MRVQKMLEELLLTGTAIGLWYDKRKRVFEASVFLGGRIDTALQDNSYKGLLRKIALEYASMQEGREVW